MPELSQAMPETSVMSFKEQVRLLRKSGQVHSTWYRARYPDVEMLGMSAAEHYLKYGAAMGRNPGKGFDTRFYLETYPDAARSRMNPLLHYVRHGARQGYRCKPWSPRGKALRAVEVLRYKILSLGFTERPLLELQEIAETHSVPAARAQAARELAMWNMRLKTPEGYDAALARIAAARIGAPDTEFRRRLTTLEILCQHFRGRAAKGHAAWERAARAGEVDPDVMLARINLEPDPEIRCALLNQVLAEFGIPPLRLRGDEALSAYDRLTAAETPAEVRDGPKVTVLVAAYNAAKVISTALRSLQEQTWRNLEILVLDDCSPDDTAAVVARHAASDPRIRLIRMARNGGAYVARNRGLDEATGDYVTLHDADDWSHPLKIETQVRFLEQTPEAMGCQSQQARATSDLGFTRWTGRGQFLIANLSSFMFRRAPVREHFGYWDTVRFSADAELVRRIQARFGQKAVPILETGPLSFQRHSDSSIIANSALGINGFLFGVRREYLHGQRFHRDRGGRLKYGSGSADRPFPVPAIMRPDRAQLTAGGRHLPVILASDLRAPGPALDACLADIDHCRAQGIPLGIVEMYRYEAGETEDIRLHMHDEVRSRIDGRNVQIIGFGEKVSCDRLVLHDPAILEERQRYVPEIDAARVDIVIPALQVEGSEAQSCRLGDCTANIRHYFGRDAIWHPVSLPVRQALQACPAGERDGIALSSEDWRGFGAIGG